jgi:hypothetical protein
VIDPGGNDDSNSEEEVIDDAPPDFEGDSELSDTDSSDLSTLHLFRTIQ